MQEDVYKRQNKTFSENMRIKKNKFYFLLQHEPNEYNFAYKNKNEEYKIKPYQ